MRLGARWGAGEAPHPGVPAELHAAIAAAEAAHPQARAWTLTWLEGRPRCELGVGEIEPPVLVSLDAAGAVRTSGSDSSAAASGWGADGAADDDDDDWLL